MNPDLKNKVFNIVPDQAARYDDTVKVLIGYVSQKYDHRVTSCIQHKDKIVGKNIIAKPKAPIKTDLDDTSDKKLDKNGEDWVTCQLQLKKCIHRVTNIDDDIQ